MSDASTSAMSDLTDTTARMASEPPMLRVSALEGGYGAVQVLFGVDLTVHAGEIVAVLGRNGVGKTTLLKHLIGELEPTGGSVEWCGHSIVGRRPSQIATAGVGYVPQEHGVFPKLTVRENLLIGARRHRSDFETLAAEVFEIFPKLADRQHQAAGTMSGGERKAVTLARALMGRPRLLLLDEPTEGVWGGVIEEIGAALTRFALTGSVVIVEQHLDFAWSIAQRAVVIDRGAVAHTQQITAGSSRDDVERLLTFSSS
jgi:branched-chain amino acid transport system ATP-binding protein